MLQISDPVASRPHSRRREIAAQALVAAPSQEVFEFLCDLENHWGLAGRCLEVVRLDGPPGARRGGVVRLRGPLGLRRTATTRVFVASAPRTIVGRAEIGDHTKAKVRWVLHGRGQATAVRLSASVEAAGRLDVLLLALGGRRWLGRRFVAALGRLADHFAAGSPRVPAPQQRPRVSAR